MIVISDTSPITNLIQIGKLDILKKLYQKIIIPATVYEELTFLENQKEILEKEDWIEKKEISNDEILSNLLERIDRGEAEAILLAIETKADYLLIDEQIGRSVAEEFGLKITGILGILIQAKQKRLISEIRFYMEQLREEAGFRIHPKLFERILKMVGEL